MYSDSILIEKLDIFAAPFVLETHPISLRMLHTFLLGFIHVMVSFYANNCWTLVFSYKISLILWCRWCEGVHYTSTLSVVYQVFGVPFSMIVRLHGTLWSIWLAVAIVVYGTFSTLMALCGTLMYMCKSCHTRDISLSTFLFLKLHVNMCTGVSNRFASQNLFNCVDILTIFDCSK